MHRLTATDTPMVRYTRTIFPSYAPELIEDSISIPKQNSEKNYCWLTNNPKGFRTWFDSINAPFIEASKNDFRNRFFQNNRTIFASVEEIPNDLYRSALQRVIQILKYHMNVYYFNLPNGDDVKPISAIINVLAGTMSRKRTHKIDKF